MCRWSAPKTDEAASKNTECRCTLSSRRDIKFGQYLSQGSRPSARFPQHMTIWLVWASATTLSPTLTAAAASSPSALPILTLSTRRRPINFGVRQDRARHATWVLLVKAHVLLR